MYVKNEITTPEDATIGSHGQTPSGVSHKLVNINEGKVKQDAHFGQVDILQEV
jgi:hypothetical protein